MTREESTDVVEMDAIDLEEWDRDRHTPRAHDTNLAELVRQSTAAEAPEPEPVIKSLIKTTSAHTTTRTPRAPSQTLPTPQPVQRTLVQTSKASLDDAWGSDAAKPPAAPPTPSRTKTSPNTLRRTDAAPVAKPAGDPPRSKRSTRTQAIQPTTTPSDPAKPAQTAAQTAKPVAPAAKPVKPAQAAKPAQATPPANPTAQAKPRAKPQPANLVAQATPPAKPVAPLAKPVAQATPPTKPVARPANPIEPAPLAQAKPTLAPQSIEPSAAPPVRASEPAMLPPPPVTTEAAEDWDDVGPRAAPAKRAEPSNDFDGLREPSVVIDLNAAPAPAETKLPQTSPVMQTSEQSATTSGAFVMPTASSPNAVRAASASSPQSPWERPSAPSPSVVARHTPTPSELADAVPQVARVEASEPRVVPRSILATVFPTPRTRRAAVIACAGAAVLVILVVAIGHRSSPPATTAATATRETPVTRPVTTTPSPKIATVAQPAAATAPATTTPAPPPTRPVRKPAVRRIASRKPVVVDYDKKPDPNAATGRDDALARARAAYAAGNQRLFAGDTAAAIAAYHQALASYPNYVAGYRGLGLAYAQQGDSVAALKAFKTYLRLAPTAKDVALISKRITRLSGH